MKSSGYEKKSHEEIIKNIIHILQKNYLSIVLFMIFFIYLYSQFSKVGIYYDDYGYYSLTYGIQSDFKGHSYTISQLLLFLKEHYSDANGRLLYFFIWLLLYHIGGLKCVQFSAAVIVTVIFGLISKIILEKTCKEKYLKKDMTFLVLLLCFLSYGVMEIGLLQFGMYWFAAMFHYVASLLPFLLFQILYFKEGAKKVGKQLFLLLLLFLSAWSEESWAVATVGFTILLSFVSLKNKQFCKWNIIYIFGSLSGLFLVLLSPGIHLRMDNHANFYTLNMIGKVIYTFPRIMFTFWTMRLFQIFFWCGQILMSVCLLKKETKKFNIILDKFYIAISSFLVFFYLLFYSQLKNHIKQENIREIIGDSIPMGMLVLCGGVVALLLLFMVMQVTRYYLAQKADCHLLIFYTSILSIVCLVVVPAIPARLFLPLVILTNILNIDVIVNFILSIRTEKKRMKASIAAVLALAVLCVPNMYQIYNGYSENAPVWKRNQKRMEDVVVRREQGDNINEVFLEKLPNKECSGEMLYFGTADHMKFWICNFYDLPYDFEFHYK